MKQREWRSMVNAQAKLRRDRLGELFWDARRGTVDGDLPAWADLGPETRAWCADTAVAFLAAVSAELGGLEAAFQAPEPVARPRSREGAPARPQRARRGKP